jgi:hypothetical protein
MGRCPRLAHEAQHLSWTARPESGTRPVTDRPLEIISVERFGPDELLAAFRETPLKTRPELRPYANAALELARGVDPDELVPAQRYVLNPKVRDLLRLRGALLACEIDLFALDGGAYIRTSDDPEGEIPITPPFVECSHEPDGRHVRLVNDGLHRVFAARSLGLPISVVVADGVPRDCPYYAFALPDGWSEVAELEELPDEYQKKEYRLPDNYKALFRDFNVVFPGIQQERKKSNPTHLRA